jgi:hypothetical protein
MRLVVLDDDVAGSGAMKPALAERHHVERHHAAEHAPPGSRSRRTAALPTPFCRLTTTTSGGAFLAMMSAMAAVSALLTVTSTMPASAKTEDFPTMRTVACDGPVKTFETRRPQAVGFDFGDDARPRQQRDAAAAGRQHAADEAADAARPCNTDRLARNHFAPTALHPASIAERAD